MESLGTSPCKMMEVKEDHEKCGSLISNCCYRNPHEKEGIKERERFFLEVFNGLACFSTVCSVKVAFVQIFHFIFQLLYFLNYF